jgi:6-phosphogluconolactonase (cycloisomerase 2 family)
MKNTSPDWQAEPQTQKQELLYLCRMKNENRVRIGQRNNNRAGGLLPGSRHGGEEFSVRKIKTETPVKSVATLVLIAAIIGTRIYGCGGGGSTSSTHGSKSTLNPTPTITAISPPNGAIAGSAAFTLSIDGTNFVATSIVNFGGTALTTTFSTATELTAVVPAAAIGSTGTVTVAVTNPAPGGGTSNAINFTIFSHPTSVALAPSGKFAYVASSSGVSMYTINSTTGALTSIGRIAEACQPEPFCVIATSIAIDPFGRFAYVTNVATSNQAGDVAMYTIDGTTGALTSIGTVDSAGHGPSSVAVDPSGKFAYVANSGDFAGGGTSLSMYTINATSGVLTTTGTIDAGSPDSVAVDPSGKFAYVADSCDGVFMYTINAATGVLTTTGTIDAESPDSVAVDPSGKFAYVANSSNDVSMYSINATTGTLTSLGPIAAGTNPSYVVVDPRGTFAYVANQGSNNVSIYGIDASTGVLTFIGTVDAGLSPTCVAIGPSGKFAYVTNSGSDNVSMYSVDPTTGGLTLIGTLGT